MAKRPDWSSFKSTRDEGRGRGREGGLFTKVLAVLFLGGVGAAIGGFALPLVIVDNSSRTYSSTRAADMSFESIMMLAGVGAAIGLISGVVAVIKYWPKD